MDYNGQDSGIPRLRRALRRLAGPLSSRNRDNPSFRNLAMRIQSDLGGARGRVVMFTSPDGLSGTNEVMTALAHSMKRDLGASVLLVDATFQPGGVGALAGHEGGPGLAELLQGGAHGLDGVVRPTRLDGVSVLPSGAPRANGAVPISGQAVAGLLDGLKGRYDYVLVETDSLMADARCMLFPPFADMVVLLAAEGKTLIEDVEECRGMLRSQDARDVRLVLTEES